MYIIHIKSCRKAFGYVPPTKEEHGLHSNVEKKLHWSLSSDSSKLAKKMETEETMSEKEMVSTTSGSVIPLCDSTTLL